MEHITVSLADQVFERLENDILCGKYERGTIISELKLATDLGVSRTPTREAIRKLEQEHLVEVTSKGIMIVGVTEKDLGDIYDIRLRIEGMAAAACAKNISDDELRVLLDAVELQEFYVTKQDPDKIKGQDSLFHQLIYKYSGSSVFFDTLLPLHNKVQKYRKASVTNNSRAEVSVKEHRYIYEAIAAHDPDVAAKRMTEHIENAKKHIIKEDLK